ncbi:signal peptide peptidase SppA [Niveispirillum lacus]|uniref:Signal peptide peptidase SppA n=1 Tax=Niveispirillum lacus TaxID=1981099 RepID=A0A255YV21_9PROT|nr:signal peptide peptidase SppA [Niveispirillum lacus]OYQ32505.1 signal peptide peptidase SppA [Niveispirillum lacus]
MRIILRVFAIIGFLSVLLVAGAIGLGYHLASRQPKLPDTIVLELDLEKPLAEAPATDPVAGLLGNQRDTVEQVVRTLNRAAKDPRVKGIIARTGNGVHSFAVTQELRDSIAKLRKEGRFAIIHAESFGELGNGMQPYYLATAFEQIWMQPMGDLAITGMQAELAFLRGTLDKLNVEPQFRQREEYKSFAEQYTETGPTPANREAVDSLVGDLFNQWVSDVALARGLNETAVRAAVDKAPLLDADAVGAKLVDKLAYWDEAVDWALEKAKAGGPEVAKPELVSLHDYSRSPPEMDLSITEAPLVAMIVGDGAILRGDSQADPLSGAETFGAATIAAAFDEAIENEQVKAILFRVNSPGGSAVASEVVRRKVLKAKAAGKPVIVSMGSVAASGGYWVSMGADRIVAAPGTITGSIGVLAGKMVLRGLTDWAGVNIEPISRGANAGMWSSNTPFTPAQEERLNAFLDSTYASFTQGVADGRNLPLDKVKQIAKGRVYTGRQAKELGLVDALGGYATALAEVRKVLKLAEDAPLRAITLPQKRSQFEFLLDMLSGDARVSLGDAMAAQVTDRTLAPYRPTIAALAPYLRTDQDMVAVMPAMVRHGF